MTEPSQRPKPTDDQLTGWIIRSGQLLRATDMTIRAEHKTRFTLLYGLCAQAIRHAESFAILAQRGHAREGGALARCALEYAVSAQYVLLTPAAVERLQHRVRREMKNYFENMADWYGMPELVDELKGQPEPDPGIIWPNFTNTMVPSLDREHFLRASYASLSRVVHVTDDSVLSFLDEDSSPAGVALRLEPRDGNHYAARYVAAASAMLALSVLADHLEKEDLLRRLDGISDELWLPMFLDEAKTEDLNARMRKSPSV